MPKPTCYKAFEQGQNDRANRPLPCGHYKLSECYEYLVEYRKEIGRIKAYVSGKAVRYNLMHCTHEDMHMWLKELPTLVAESMAYEPLPGLATLDKDWADPDFVKRAYPPSGACLYCPDRTPCGGQIETP